MPSFIVLQRCLNDALCAPAGLCVGFRAVATCLNKHQKEALCRVTDAITKALTGYEFNEAGRLMYEFFWFDFADWYIEIAKASLYSDNQAAKKQTQEVLAYVLERSMRLWHPYVPFVTETLWKSIPHSGEALMAKEWPETGLPRCDVAQHQFSVLKNIVTSVRNARSEYNVDLSKKVSAVVCVEDTTLKNAMASELDSICLLAKIDRESAMVCHAACILWISSFVPLCLLLVGLGLLACMERFSGAAEASTCTVKMHTL
jgi:valyl-tRNA synthetase